MQVKRSLERRFALSKSMRNIVLIILTIVCVNNLFSQDWINNIKQKYGNNILIKTEFITNDTDLVVVSGNKDKSSNIYTIAIHKAGKYIELLQDEINIRAYRVLNLDNTFIVEITAITTMGNGSTYLYNLNGNTILKAVTIDLHEELLEYYEYHKIDQFKMRKYTGERISRIFENTILNDDYSNFTKGIIRFYGNVLYISENDNKREIIYKDRIELKFKKDGDTFKLNEIIGDENRKYF